MLGGREKSVGFAESVTMLPWLSPQMVERRRKWKRTTRRETRKAAVERNLAAAARKGRRPEQTLGRRTSRTLGMDARGWSLSRRTKKYYYGSQYCGTANWKCHSHHCASDVLLLHHNRRDGLSRSLSPLSLCVCVCICYIHTARDGWISKMRSLTSHTQDYLYSPF